MTIETDIAGVSLLFKKARGEEGPLFGGKLIG